MENQYESLSKELVNKMFPDVTEEERQRIVKTYSTRFVEEKSDIIRTVRESSNRIIQEISRQAKLIQSNKQLKP